jgi:glycosyltransferase involved in cell wall biosynthesis
MSLRLYGWPTNLKFRQLATDSFSNQGRKFSVVIPTLNQADTIEHTLLSIIHQDYKNFEIIVIDGGSTDNTTDIINKYRPWITYYISGVDSGQSNAINRGFALATGDIYAWINSDDYYLPFAFRRIAEQFSNHKEIDIIVGSGDVISKDFKFLKHITPMQMERQNLLRWLEGKWIMQQACFWTDKVWKECGGVDESLQLLMDFDLWFRFSKLGRSRLINEPLAAMRYYPDIKTVTLKDIVKEETAYVFAKNSEFTEVRKIVGELVMRNKDLIDGDAQQNKLIIRRILHILGVI